MFTHLGGNTLVLSNRIVAIINAENSLGAHSTKEFLKNAQAKGFVERLNGEDFKAIIVSDEAVYLSPISAMTLKKRAESILNNL